jgi:hypothetical protein
VRAWIAAGIARSATFRSLVDALAETDVVVYVQPALVRGRLGGYVPHRVAAVDNVRYVFAVVAPDASTPRRIAVIAHELQHALEIARVPHAGRTQPVAELFSQIGFHSRSGYETIAAIDVEGAVRTELAARAAACGRP